MQPLLDTKTSIEGQCPKIEVNVASTDVNKAGQVDTAFDRFAGSGGVDILISNAAIVGLLEPVGEWSGDKYLRLC